MKVKYVTNDSCINDFSYGPRAITDSMMCALDSASDACHGGERYFSLSSLCKTRYSLTHTILLLAKTRVVLCMIW